MYRLLIVDDEEDIRHGIARGIPWAQLGFEVAGQAGDGQEAVGLLEKTRPDVVLSDIRMPKMDGIELMQYLYTNNPEIKIIILSGYNDVEYLNMAIKNQVIEYLLKPTDIDEFCELFKSLKTKLDAERQQKRELESLKAFVEQSKELSYGRVFITYLGALQNVSTDLLEAAQIDGATKWERIWHIVIPSISPTTFFLLISSVITSLQNFTTIQALTGGGPGQATTVMSINIIRTAFSNYQTGYASAQALIMFLIVLAITLVQWQGQKKWVNY